MSFDEFARIMQPAVETELKAAVVEIGKDDPDAGRYRTLRHMLAYHLGWEGPGAGKEAQGKRIRPLLVLLSCAASGGEWEKALPAAAAVELLHNFSLIHDDIQDQSTLRRGRETVWVKWGAAQAINAGDLMFTLAQSTLLKLSETASPQIAVEAGRVFQDTCLKLTEGQYLDMSYEARSDLTREDYFAMIAGKTAALLSACAELGALVGGAERETVDAFCQFGEALGLAFQVQDDWLGIWGDASITGKSTASDLVTGKKTLPVLYGLEQRGEFAARWHKGPLRAEEVEEMALLLAREGAQEYTQTCADRLTRQAIEALGKASPVRSEAGAALLELARKLGERKS
ncbi:MAG TPA: polyprenyl synthetase family protein [Anaerolineaceae bacterium]|nr:polyprenyl synthetase family protein [Anaerolineaceae bacterium]